VKYAELEKILRERDCYFDHNGANHPLWKSAKTGRVFPMSHHRNQEVRLGTLKSILTAAGVKI
jgi:hypothetical protein